jgi:hypothetical protein
MKAGTWTTSPVSSLAALVTLEAVANIPISSPELDAYGFAFLGLGFCKAFSSCGGLSN